MKIVYVGPFVEGVVVPYIEDNQHKSQSFLPGVSVEVPDELAELLLVQVDNYQPEATARAKPKTEATTPGG